MSDNRSDIINVLLICREGKCLQIYQDELDILGVNLVCVQSLMDFFRLEVYCPLNGILVDMPTYMRISDEEKRLLTELVGIFPSMRLKCQELTGEIRTLPFSTAYSGNLSPAIFVEKYCRSFNERKIRTSDRTQQNLPALLNAIPLVVNIPVARTMTADISCGGCFLICFEPWIVGERGWLVLPDLKDTSPIPVEICWTRSWGKSHNLPGMGIRFTDLTDSQRIELNRLGGKSFFLDDSDI